MCSISQDVRHELIEVPLVNVMTTCVCVCIFVYVGNVSMYIYIYACDLPTFISVDAYSQTCAGYDSYPISRKCADSTSFSGKTYMKQ